MQVVIAVVLAVVLMSLIAAVLIAVLSMAAIGLAIGIPAYLLIRYMNGRRPQLVRVAQSPLERLQQLYIEGKIDLFEFEQRAARLIAVERH